MDAVIILLADALVALKTEEYGLAEERLSRVVAEASSQFGPNDIVTARALGYLARVCATQKKYDLAIPMYERLLRIHQALPEPSNSDHASALIELAALSDGVTDRVESAGALKAKGNAMLADIAERMAKADAEVQGGTDSESSEDDQSEESDSENESDHSSSNKACGDRIHQDEQEDKKDFIQEAGNTERSEEILCTQKKDGLDISQKF